MELQCFHSYSILQVFGESHLANQSQMELITETTHIFGPAVLCIITHTVGWILNWLIQLEDVKY